MTQAVLGAVSISSPVAAAAGLAARSGMQGTIGIRGSGEIRDQRKGRTMVKIRHIALASDHPGKAAEFYKKAFGFKELRRFGLDPDKPDEAPRPSGVFLTDGTLNIAILKFANDQLGKGIDFVGVHHFGVVVDDTEAWTRKLEAMGAPCIPDQVPPGAHAELKFRGPDGVVFDITGRLWEGSAPVEDELPTAAE
jgi:catechol 2,3-dioxygenase-like lactoylglutathione lyase family enzyme